MSRHTPEPWSAPGPWTNDRFEIQGDGRQVAIVNTKEDARLIAAAPDLLEALRIIVANARMIPDPAMDGATDCFAVPLGDIEEIAHAAIAKATNATGKQE